MTQSGLFDVGEWLLAQDCLSPKLRGGWHVFYWQGPEMPARWTQEAGEAHLFPSPEAALDAWRARVEQLGGPSLARQEVRAVPHASST